MMSAVEGQEDAECRKICGRGGKRTQILGTACSTSRLTPQRPYPACRFNGRILLTNPMFGSYSPKERFYEETTMVTIIDGGVRRELRPLAWRAGRCWGLCRYRDLLH